MYIHMGSTTSCIISHHENAQCVKLKFVCDQFFECLRFKMSKHEHSMLHQIPRKSFQMQYENKGNVQNCYLVIHKLLHVLCVF